MPSAHHISKRCEILGLIDVENGGDEGDDTMAVFDDQRARGYGGWDGRHDRG